MSPAKL